MKALFALALSLTWQTNSEFVVEAMARKTGGHVDRDRDGAIRLVYVTGPEVDDEFLAAMTGAQSVRAIALKGTSVTADGLKGVLPHFPKLSHVHLSHTEVKAGAIKAIASVPKVAMLTIDSDGTFGDEQLADVCELFKDRLEDLSLLRTAVTDKGMKSLVKCKKLAGFSLDRSHVTDKGIEVFAEMPTLRSATVIRSKLTVAAAAFVKAKAPHVQGFLTGVR
jgi:hypothetical protein